MQERRTEVLVVGAGPVGLWTAWLLTQAGLEVKIVDREERTATRSYACALHPGTLELLASAGLAEEVLAQGRRIPSVAFYEGASRQAELKLSALAGPYPFLLILPQSALETTLEQRLRQAGVRVDWNHRFDTCAQEGEEVLSVIEELEGTSTGYIVPHWENVVKQRHTLRSQFVVGADGHNSLLRQRLGIPLQGVCAPERFAAFEFQSDQSGEDEVRVVLTEGTVNVLWPLLDQRFRWTFQFSRPGKESAFPDKDRRQARAANQTVDDRIRAHVETVAGQRAPWFHASVREIAWCTEVVFEQRVASRFGSGRCWLAGDAAHQTGPVGVQSMNAGFFEARDLAALFTDVARNAAPAANLQSHDQRQQALWKQLLGLTGGLKPRPATAPWCAQRAAAILPCLPAVNGRLFALANQLQFDIS